MDQDNLAGGGVTSAIDLAPHLLERSSAASTACERLDGPWARARQMLQKATIESHFLTVGANAQHTVLSGLDESALLQPQRKDASSFIVSVHPIQRPSPS
jgi:hypothetical protein